MHSLLARQLRLHVPPEMANDPAWRAFLDAVDRAYCTADDDRRLLERSMELASDELLERYERLQLDLTARIAAEQALQRSQQRLALHVGQTAIGVIECDPSGVILEWNPAAERIFGYTRGEAIGKDGVSLIVPSEGQPSARARLVDLRGRPPGEEKVRENVTKAGRVITCEWRSTPLIDPEGRVVAIASLVEDITDRRRQDENLQRAQRLAALGTLAAGVAHEVNNPLAYVTANVQFARQTLEAPRAPTSEAVSEVVIALTESEQGLARVRRIVADFRTLSLPQADERGACDPGIAAESAIGIAWNKIRHRATLRRQFTTTEWVAMDESRLTQVLVNLLVNAAQALPDGRAETNEVAVAIAEDGDLVRLCVRDTGTGMTAAVRERIFDPFFSTKAVGEGSGLGLFVSHAMVQASGGTIEVDSEPGRGSTFTIRLRRVQRHAATGPQIEGSEPVTPESRRRLLIVDDELLVIRALHRLLTPSYDVLTFDDPHAALDTLQRDAAFDAILCDLMMPQMTGFEFATRLRALDPELAARVLFMSGGASISGTWSFANGTETRVLAKPIDCTRLRAALDRIPAVRPR